MADISKNIKRFRQKHGMSQAQLAEKIGVTRQTVSSWERENSFPDIMMLESLAETFHTQVDALIYPEKNQKKQKLIKEVLVTPLSPKCILISVLTYFILYFWGGPLITQLLMKFFGGGIEQTWFYQAYWGQILLVFYMAFYAVLITDYIVSYSNKEPNIDEQPGECSNVKCP